MIRRVRDLRVCNADLNRREDGALSLDHSGKEFVASVLIRRQESGVKLNYKRTERGLGLPITTCLIILHSLSTESRAK